MWLLTYAWLQRYNVMSDLQVHKRCQGKGFLLRSTALASLFQIPVYFIMPSKYTTDDVGAIFLIRRTQSDKKMLLMVCKLANSMQPSPCVIMN